MRVVTIPGSCMEKTEDKMGPRCTPIIRITEGAASGIISISEPPLLKPISGLYDLPMLPSTTRQPRSPPVSRLKTLRRWTLSQTR